MFAGDFACNTVWLKENSELSNIAELDEASEQSHVYYIYSSREAAV